MSYVSSPVLKNTGNLLGDRSPQKAIYNVLTTNFVYLTNRTWEYLGILQENISGKELKVIFTEEHFIFDILEEHC